MYSGFAAVYDLFMVEGPHADWLAWLERAERSGMLPPVDGLAVADVGCGTGSLTVQLASRFHRVTGIDLSPDMLAQASSRAREGSVNALWLCQDVRRLRLPQPVDIAFSTCDCLNYLLTPDDWAAALAAIAGNLVPAGWLCFDVLGPARLASLQQGVWHDVRDAAVALFETDVSSAGRITFEVHAFVADTSTPLFHRVEERHEQQFWPAEQIHQALCGAGFTVLEALGDFGRSSPAQADRLVFVAQKSR